MKVKTLRAIIQAGLILAFTLFLSLAVILIVQFVELKNAEQRYNDLLNNSGSYSVCMVESEKPTFKI